MHNAQKHTNVNHQGGGSKKTRNPKRQITQKHAPTPHLPHLPIGNGLKKIQDTMIFIFDLDFVFYTTRRCSTFFVLLASPFIATHRSCPVAFLPKQNHNINIHLFFEEICFQFTVKELALFKATVATYCSHGAVT